MLQFASFFRLKIPRTVFKNCKLEDVEFVETDLNGASFYQCDLQGAVFEQTNLEGADLQTALHFSIDPEVNRIQKARFSTQNIAGLLQKYKIVIQ
jgi:fluoroquinolone resistance protein